MPRASTAWTVATVMAAAVCVADAQAPDAVAAAPDIHRLVVDNPYVRVLETRFRAGQRVTLHAHSARVVVVLNG